MTECTRCGKTDPAEIHTCTPLAVTLADQITSQHMGKLLRRAAANELRRLSAENDWLQREIAEQRQRNFAANERLVGQVQPLRDALAAVVEHTVPGLQPSFLARAAAPWPQVVAALWPQVKP